MVEIADRAVDEAAERLLSAFTTGVPVAPVRELIGGTDISRAYRVQQRIIDDRVQAGAKVVGRKIGLTSEAVQRQVGVDQPDFGVLLDRMRYGSGDVIPFGTLLQPRAEVEIAFVLASDLDGEFSDDGVRAAIAYASPAIEIVDSRVRNWDIEITDTVADNASSGAFVIGDAKVDLAEFEPRDVTMALRANGTEVSSGAGVACLGDPLNAVAWLAATAVEYGAPLRAGEIILSGALGPLAPIGPGQVLDAAISTLGTVTAKFSGGEPR